MRSKIMPINLPMTNNKSKPSDTGCYGGTDKKYWSIAQARGKSSLMLVHFDIPWSQSINKSFLSKPKFNQNSIELNLRLDYILTP